ncbi:hypothetical protein Taro_034695 [Colocasia esculenta]|uniref:Uncharacterized protein n=1 Tax=Colocasia esculenta TaxID=4460 RepID=A0A843W3M7_COLES|nr:hypothetical protein [Colocasia esculenta]
MESCWDWGRMDSYMARHVQLHILGRRRGGGRRRRVAADGGSVVSTDDGQEEHDSLSTLMLWRCLGGHPWTSSLRHLVLADIPGRGFSGVHHPLPPLPSLQQLWFNGCREMRRLPRGMLLSQLTALKDLKIVDCPELTFASVDAGIRSVPSLESLVILRCPKLAMPAPQPSSPHVIPDSSDQEDRSSPPPPPAAPPPPPLFPRLRHLHVDDIRLLTRWVLVDHNPVFTSLRYFALSQSELTCLTAEEEGVLSTLASSFRCLAFYDCPNLEKLPADLKGLLPNLKVLIIQDCPKFRCLPAGRGLPTLLEMLSIKRCPELSRRGSTRETIGTTTRWRISFASPFYPDLLGLLVLTNWYAQYSNVINHLRRAFD